MFTWTSELKHQLQRILWDTKSLLLGIVIERERETNCQKERPTRQKERPTLAVFPCQFLSDASQQWNCHTVNTIMSGHYKKEDYTCRLPGGLRRWKIQIPKKSPEVKWIWVNCYHHLVSSSQYWFRIFSKTCTCAPKQNKTKQVRSSRDYAII